MPEPLIALDGAGKAAIISYSVPEPISYSGNNYIQLPLPEEAFATVVTHPAAAPVKANQVGSVAKQTAQAAAILVPQAVSVGPGDPAASPVTYSTRPLSARLAALTNAGVAAIAAGGGRVVLYPDVSGRLDVRVTPARAADPTDPDRGLGGDRPIPEVPFVSIFLDSPSAGAQMHGSAAGITFMVVGRWSADNVNPPTIRLTVDTEAPVPVGPRPDGTWSAPVTVTTAGPHTLTAKISATGRRNVADSAETTVTVLLDPADPMPAPVLPTVRITAPVDNTTVVDPSGQPRVTITGEASAGPGNTVAGVAVTDQASGTTVQAGRVGTDWSSWSVELLLDGTGPYELVAFAADSAGYLSSPQFVRVTVSTEQPFRRRKNRLLLVETLNLSSYLGSFGAGRVVKTFSLMPGEKTTISVKSWTKSSDSRKAGSSIVDSDASESASDFEDTLSAEQTNKEAHDETTHYKVGAEARATWGWGEAKISGEYSGSANAAREEAVKNLNTTVQKHSMKASSNRNVSINTEYTATHEDGTEDSTTREISNINVSRTLNFVFRQMNQEHLTLIHLTNVRIGYFTEDLLLDDKGEPAYTTDATGAKVLKIRNMYTEVPLPELGTLLASVITSSWQPKVREAILFALSGIPDYQDKLRAVYEEVTPVDSTGQPVDGAAYLRFPRNLHTDFTAPATGQQITVPGIVLAHDQIVMRTDGVLVDALLGQGDGLDTYSHQLQDVAIEERRTAIVERQAEIDRLALARKIVADRDEAAAAIFGTIFPPPSPPTAESNQ